METINDIVRDLRSCSDDTPEGYITIYPDQLADRIEKAHKREIEDTIAATVDEPHIQAEPVGNAAKMRKALEGVRDWLVVHNAYVDTEREIVKLNAALAEPLRNCDVGTPEEWEVRFKNYCWNHSTRDKNMECQCPIDAKGKAGCKFEWAQMPYEKGEAE